MIVGERQRDERAKSANTEDKRNGVTKIFKKRRGIHIPYNKQGLIYFTCMNIKDMPEEVQQKVLNLCIEVGEEDYRALYEVVTNDRKSVLSVSLEHHISEKKLYQLRKEFYEKW